MRVLMIGPANGHNIRRFLKWFNDRAAEHQFDYYRYDAPRHFELGAYERINVIGTYDLFGLTSAIRKAEVIWVHNWTPWTHLALILTLKPKKAILNFNFWSEKLPRQILADRGWKGNLYRRFFNNCDVLQSSWYSVKNLADQFNPERSQLLRWGFEEEYFRPVVKEDLGHFTLEFTEALPREKFKFFVPKTIGFPNRHDLMVEAAENLTRQGITDFRVYFWEGNTIDQAVREKLVKQIEQLGVQEQVQIIRHPFLANEDIIYIWQQMDCGLQLCDQDQLSTAFTEPQLFKIPLIASDISSYQLYNQHFGLAVPLVSNDKVESIAATMQDAIEGKLDSAIELNRRQEVIKTHYRFSENMEKIIAYFEALRQQKA